MGGKREEDIQVIIVIVVEDVEGNLRCLMSVGGLVGMYIEQDWFDGINFSPTNVGISFS